MRARGRQPHGVRLAKVMLGSPLLYRWFSMPSQFPENRFAIFSWSYKFDSSGTLYIVRESEGQGVLPKTPDT